MITMPIFSVNIEEILCLEVWRISPCDFQVRLKDILDLEENFLFKNKTLYFKNNEKKIHKGFLKNYAGAINFIEQLECYPKVSEDFLKDFSQSTNLTNIFNTFGEPHIHTGTSEGYDIFIYLGTHNCQNYECNGMFAVVVGPMGNIVAYNFTISRCPCYFNDADMKDENNVYIKCKKSEFI